MKKLLCISFFSCLSMFGIGQSILDKKIDFTADKLPLKKAIFQLSQQLNTGFTFNGNIIPTKTVSLNFQKTSVNTILDYLFVHTPIRYKLVEEQIVLYKIKRKVYFTISGYIKDSENGERLIAANVFENKYQKGIATNEYGFYSVTFPKGTVHLNFSFLGYRPASKKLNLKRNTRLDITLKPSLTLKEVVVTSKGIQAGLPTFTGKTNTIPISTMNQLPALGGEEDLLRTVNLLAGVQSGPDGFGGLNVRGGSTDQNLILLDGVPVYNATHSGGLFSIFNSSAIKNAQLYKGNFPARYGGRLSSILDVRTKEGNQRKLAGEAAIGLISAKGAIEGPIVRDKSSFFFSFRRSIFDVFLKPISRKVKKKKGDTGFTEHFFADFNGKVNFFLGKKDQVFLSFYHGKDHFLDNNNATTNQLAFRTVDHNQELNWGNTISSLRWNHLFNERLFANTTLTFSKFWFDSEEYYEEETIEATQSESEQIQRNLFYNLYNSSIEDKAAKIDFDYNPSTNHYIKFGAGFIQHTFSPGAFTLDHNSGLGVNDRFFVDSLIAVNNTVRSQEFSLYGEDNWTLSPKLKGNFGFRSTLINVQSTRYFTFQPRFSLTYQLDKTNHLNASLGKMMQNLHLLTTSGVGLPTDLWVPATSKVKPQEAWQGTIAWTKWLPKGFEINATAYYKSMKNLITYEEGSSFLIESIVLDASNWENKVTNGTGKSYADGQTYNYRLCRSLRQQIV